MGSEEVGRQRAGLILFACFALLIVYHNDILSWSLSERQEPAFLLPEWRGVAIEVRVDDLTIDLCQYFDGDSVECANGVTLENSLFTDESPLPATIQRGCPVSLTLNDNRIAKARLKSWQQIPAGQQIALGIPLNPDCMTALDWQLIPGIGEKTSASIIEYRQKNGDFGSLEGVKGVRGVGDKTIERLRKYF